MPDTSKWLFAFMALHAETFHKSERLCRRKHMHALLSEGQRMRFGMLQLLVKSYVATKGDPICHQLVVFVSKRRIASAVVRNRLRRRMKEAYRRDKQILAPLLSSGTTLLIGYSYQSNRPCSYRHLQSNVRAALRWISLTYGGTPP